MPLSDRRFYGQFTEYCKNLRKSHSFRFDPLSCSCPGQSIYTWRLIVKLKTTVTTANIAVFIDPGLIRSQISTRLFQKMFCKKTHCFWYFFNKTFWFFSIFFLIPLCNLNSFAVSWIWVLVESRLYSLSVRAHPIWRMTRYGTRRTGRSHRWRSILLMWWYFFDYYRPVIWTSKAVWDIRFQGCKTRKLDYPINSNIPYTPEHRHN